MLVASGDGDARAEREHLLARVRDEVARLCAYDAAGSHDLDARGNPGGAHEAGEQGRHARAPRLLCVSFTTSERVVAQGKLVALTL